MFCSNCGALNSDEAHFCQSCGHQFSVSTATALNTMAANLEKPSDAQVNSGFPTYAGFWERFASVFLDGIVLTFFTIPALIVIAVAEGAGNDDSGIWALGYFLTFVVSALYYSIMESGEKSATYGKRWIGLKVLDVNYKRISGGRAFGRWISHFLSYVTFYIGFLIQPFTTRKQALHDITSATIVVRAKDGQKSSVAAIVIAVLFIAVMSIGMLAAIAIPAYQDYVTRAKVTEGIALGNAASQAVEAYYLQTGTVPATLGVAGFSAISGKYVSNVEIDPENAIVVVTFGNVGSSQIDGKTLAISPFQNEDNTILWKCSSDEIEARYLPASCK